MNSTDCPADTLALYDEVEAIAARYENRQKEIKAVTVEAERLGLAFKQDYLTEHKRDSWREILEKSNARQWLSTRQEKIITDQLYKKPKELPEITVEGLRGWLQDIVTAGPDMLAELCREAFEVLTPQRDYGPRRIYKSNENKREIPKSGRVVLFWVCSHKSGGTPELSYQTSAHQRLNVLDRVFSLLDGKPMPEGDETTVRKCRDATLRQESEVTVFWGKLKMHLNGNLHVWLTRQDLLEKLIALSAGKNLCSGPMQTRRAS